MDLVQFKGLGQRGAAYWLSGLFLLAAQLAPAAELPPWHALAFEQEAYGLTARSRLEIIPDSQRQHTWLLTVDSSIARNSEHITLTLEAGSCRLLEKLRFSKGSGQRSKLYRYLPDHILRERRAPSFWSKAPPREWPVSSRREIAYPGSEKSLVLTDAYALVLLAAQLAPDGQDSLTAVVHTDLNFYRVDLSVSPGPDLAVDYTVAGQAARVSGAQPTLQVTLRASPVGEQEDEPDFSLMGLQGGITLLFGRESGLLLQARGSAPRAGEISINLREVTPR